MDKWIIDKISQIKIQQKEIEKEHEKTEKNLKEIAEELNRFETMYKLYLSETKISSNPVKDKKHIKKGPMNKQETQERLNKIVCFLKLNGKVDVSANPIAEYLNLSRESLRSWLLRMIKNNPNCPIKIGKNESSFSLK